MSTCDMRDDCAAPVTHIGSKGYVYCAGHAPQRRGWESTRKMRAWERRWIEEGRPLPSYKPMPEPKDEPAPNAYVPPQPHEFESDGHTYRLMLPAHFLTEATDQRDYYVWLLSQRIRSGYIGPDETRGTVAGAYGWERIA